MFFFIGIPEDEDQEMKYWTWWIEQRMKMVKKTCQMIDMFIAPSKHLQQRFITEFGLPAEKVMYLPYGFDRSVLTSRQRVHRNPNDPIVFGYIGRHSASKGINLLLEAAQQIPSHYHHRFCLAIYGRPDANTTANLQAMAASKGFHVEWRPEYKNNEIVSCVFNHVDCIVVPSIWDENSPLVIQEAQQCRVPVITANHAGMSELVQDHINGLTFQHRNSTSLAKVMRLVVEQPEILEKLSQHGYLYSNDGQVPSIESHVDQLLNLYSTLNTRQHENIKPLAAPRRITFDTNPDDCNFSCVMCEQHSEYSPHQKARKEAKIRRRRMDFDLMKQIITEAAPLGLEEIVCYFFFRKVNEFD